MSIIEKVMENWVAGVKEDYHDSNKPEKGFDLLYLQVRPRFKHFRPPMWKIFLWAYKVQKKVLFKDCYPTAMSSSTLNPDKELEITFNCHPLRNDKVDKIAEKVKGAYRSNNLDEMVINGTSGSINYDVSSLENIDIKVRGNK